MVQPEHRRIMRLLFVASDSMEYSGLLTRVPGAVRAPIPLNWVRAGKLGGHEAMLTANGAGWKRAAAAVDTAAPFFHPDAVISIGFCGALEEDLRVADLVIGTEIADPHRRYAVLPVVGSGPRRGVVCSIDHVARSAEEKRRLQASGSCVVEMEAAGAAGRAEALGLPFYCLKAVTDLASETLANDFNAALRSDGHFDTMIILKGALREPTVRLPELLRLRNRCVRAARGLGDFIADCRF
jgi:adenosylhomocysteine nucleosidase